MEKKKKKLFASVIKKCFDFSISNKYELSLTHHRACFKISHQPENPHVRGSLARFTLLHVLLIKKKRKKKRRQSNRAISLM